MTLFLICSMETWERDFLSLSRPFICGLDNSAVPGPIRVEQAEGDRYILAGGFRAGSACDNSSGGPGLSGFLQKRRSECNASLDCSCAQSKSPRFGLLLG